MSGQLLIWYLFLKIINKLKVKINIMIFIKKKIADQFQLYYSFNFFSPHYMTLSFSWYYENIGNIKISIISRNDTTLSHCSSKIKECCLSQWSALMWKTCRAFLFKRNLENCLVELRILYMIVSKILQMLIQK